MSMIEGISMGVIEQMKAIGVTPIENQKTKLFYFLKKPVELLSQFGN